MLNKSPAELSNVCSNCRLASANDFIHGLNRRCNELAPPEILQ